MSKKINPKAIVAQHTTSIFIFFYPAIILLCGIIYLIKSKNFSQILLIISMALMVFIPSILHYYQKSIVITKKSIYIFLRGKEILKWSIETDLYLVDVRQDKLGAFLGYGTLVLVNQDKKLYEYFFLSNPNLCRDKLIISYEKIMKKLDPNYISSYNLDSNVTEEKIDVIED